MRLLRPLPPGVTRPLAVLVLASWAASMGLLVHRAYLQAPTTLAADLARYVPAAQWRGVYYKGGTWLLSMRIGIEALDGMGSA